MPKNTALISEAAVPPFGFLKVGREVDLSSEENPKIERKIIQATSFSSNPSEAIRIQGHRESLLLSLEAHSVRMRVIIGNISETKEIGG